MNWLKKRLSKLDSAIQLIVVYIIATIIVLSLIAVVGTFMGCKLTRGLKKTSEDSTAVKKEDTNYSRVDTSKSSKEKDYERTTYVFGRDTTINNYYPQPSIIIQERGKEKEQTQSFDYESFRQEILDSISSKKEVKEVESKTKIGPSFVEWILIGVVAFLLLSKFFTIKKI